MKQMREMGKAAKATVQDLTSVQLDGMSNRERLNRERQGQADRDDSLKSPSETSSGGVRDFVREKYAGAKDSVRKLSAHVLMADADRHVGKLLGSEDIDDEQVSELHAALSYIEQARETGTSGIEPIDALRAARRFLKPLRHDDLVKRDEDTLYSALDSIELAKDSLKKLRSDNQIQRSSNASEEASRIGGGRGPTSISSDTMGGATRFGGGGGRGRSISVSSDTVGASGPGGRGRGRSISVSGDTVGTSRPGGRGHERSISVSSDAVGTSRPGGRGHGRSYSLGEHFDVQDNRNRRGRGDKYGTGTTSRSSSARTDVSTENYTKDDALAILQGMRGSCQSNGWNYQSEAIDRAIDAVNINKIEDAHSILVDLMRTKDHPFRYSKVEGVSTIRDAVRYFGGYTQAQDKGKRIYELDDTRIKNPPYPSDYEDGDRLYPPDVEGDEARQDFPGSPPPTHRVSLFEAMRRDAPEEYPFRPENVAEWASGRDAKRRAERDRQLIEAQEQLRSELIEHANSGRGAGNTSRMFGSAFGNLNTVEGAVDEMRRELSDLAISADLPGIPVPAELPGDEEGLLRVEVPGTEGVPRLIVTRHPESGE